MNYKKLNEVDVIESMSDSGFVLGVDESGGVKRVPKSTMGKIKTINGAEPDENGNIEAVEDKSKTCFMGLRFHPESLYLTDENHNNIIKKFIEICSNVKRENLDL